MLKIGLFSKLSRVSIRMLRYYDEIGLLHPAYIDPESDYRYYREDQLPQIGWITALRDMGFSLADVCRMTEIGHDAEKLAPYFEARRRELEADAAKTARQLLLLESARNRLGKEDIMQYNVTIKTIPERYAACVHTIIPRYSEEGSVWKTLCEETDGMRLVPGRAVLLRRDVPRRGIQGTRRGDRSVEDRQGQLSRYSAREIQNAPRCYRRKLHVPRPV